MLQRTLARKNRLRYSRLGERTFQNLANQQTPDPSPEIKCPGDPPGSTDLRGVDNDKLYRAQKVANVFC